MICDLNLTINIALALFFLVVFPIAFFSGYWAGRREIKHIDDDFAFSLWAIITKSDTRMRSLEEDGNIQDVCDKISRILSEEEKRIIKESDIHTATQSYEFLSTLKKEKEV